MGRLSRYIEARRNGEVRKEDMFRIEFMFDKNGGCVFCKERECFLADYGTVDFVVMVIAIKMMKTWVESSYNENGTKRTDIVPLDDWYKEDVSMIDRSDSKNIYLGVKDKQAEIEARLLRVAHLIERGLDRNLTGREGEEDCEYGYMFYFDLYSVMKLTNAEGEAMESLREKASREYGRSLK